MIAQKKAIIKKILYKTKEFLFYNPFKEYLSWESVLSITLFKGGVCVSYIKKVVNRLKLKHFKISYFSDSYPGPDEFAIKIKTIFSEMKVKNNTYIILTIPDDWVLITTFTLPANVIENIPQLLEFEMDRFTPLTAEQVFFDYAIVDLKENKIYIALFLVKKDKLKPYIDALNEKGINLNSITFSGAALSMFFTISENLKTGVILQQNKEEILKRFIYNKYPIYSGICKENTLLKKPKTLHIGPKEVDTVIFLNISLNDLPVKKAINADKISFKGLKLKGDTTEEIISKAAAVSALYKDKELINILTSGIHKIEKRPILATIIISIFIIFILCLKLFIPLIKEKKEVEYLSGIIETLKPQVVRVEQMKKHQQNILRNIKAIRSFKSSSTTLEILKEITLLLPKDTWVTRLIIKDKKIKIEGYSDSATGLISILESSSLLKNVSFSSPVYKDRRLKKERFKIKAELE